MKKHDQECCPPFDVQKWDKKTFNWEKEHFIKDTIGTFFHYPFPPIVRKKITKLRAIALHAQATIHDKSEGLILLYDPSPFLSEIHYRVMREVEGADNSEFSGTFVTRVFDGPYKEIPRFMHQMKRYLTERNLTAEKYFIHYAYCPDCAKAHGHNYMVFFAQVQ